MHLEIISETPTRYHRLETLSQKMRDRKNNVVQDGPPGGGGPGGGDPQPLSGGGGGTHLLLAGWKGMGPVVQVPPAASIQFFG